jgi:endonuclease III-like uncharacterized protein
MRQTVQDTDSGLECEICGLWYHTKCQDVNEAMYKALATFSTDLNWFCKSCNKSTEKLFVAINQTQTRMDNLERELNRLNEQHKLD